MDNITTTDVYLPVDVKERLPEKTQGYFTYNEDDFQGVKIPQCLGANMFRYGKFETDTEFDALPSHWLEPKQGMIVLTKDELIKIVGDAFDSGMRYGEIDYGVKNEFKKKTQYIATLFAAQS